jgi:hypothetical protein
MFSAITASEKAAAASEKRKITLENFLKALKRALPNKSERSLAKLSRVSNKDPTRAEGISP